MDHGQDEDVMWRRAFADSSGLFDNCNIPPAFGPLLGVVDNTTATTSLPCPSPSPVAINDAILADSNAERLPPSTLSPPTPTPEFTAPQPLPQQAILPCPPLVPSAPAPALMVIQQKKQIVMPAVNLGASTINTPDWLVTARNGSRMLGGSTLAAAPGVGSGNANATAAAAAILNASAEVDEFQGGAAQQRGADSCARKRDRAKLLRQQMNDGLDSLHKALVEISTSGANPCAAATTGLIPTRGPRRAAVVACSSGLVRDLIATCVTLRTENATLSERLASTTLALQSTPAAQAGLSNGELASAAIMGSMAATGGGGEVRTGCEEVAEGQAGVGAANVFGQLLALNVFAFLGPQSLEEGRAVCRSWRDKCTWDYCWSNICASRWRLCPEERHVEVWRTEQPEAITAMVSPPVPPPSWRQIYGRLHKELRVPTGAFLPAHLVIGRSVHEGVAVWIGLSRRSNGMTGRSVMGPKVFRTTEVVELRAVIQRVDEGPAIAVHPRAFRVRRLGTNNHNNSFGFNGGSSSSSSSNGAASKSAMGSVFPPVSDGDARFAPRVTVNAQLDGRDEAVGACVRGLADGGSSSSAGGGSGGGSAMLALNEYAKVDFFIETSGCPTERDFLRLATCVDVGVSRRDAECGRGGKTATVVPVALNERDRDTTTICCNPGFSKAWRPSKRRVSSA